MSKSFARFLSAVGHPILMVTYTLFFLLWVNPYAFGVSAPSDKKAIMLMLSVFFTTTILPGLGIMLMKPLGLLKNLEMPGQQERIGPYIVGGVFYLWLYINLRSTGHTPAFYNGLVLGSTMTLFACFFANIFTKISVHAAGVGGAVSMVLLTNIYWGGHTLAAGVMGGTLFIGLPVILALAVVFAGSVGASRLVMGAHTPEQLYRGYAVGFFCTLAGVWLVA
jgi:hypothetical protein